MTRIYFGNTSTALILIIFMLKDEVQILCVWNVKQLRRSRLAKFYSEINYCSVELSINDNILSLALSSMSDETRG